LRSDELKVCHVILQFYFHCVTLFLINGPIIYMQDMTHVCVPNAENAQAKAA